MTHFVARLVMKTTEGVFSRNKDIVCCSSSVRAPRAQAGKVLKPTCLGADHKQRELDSKSFQMKTISREQNLPKWLAHGAPQGVDSSLHAQIFTWATSREPKRAVPNFSCQAGCGGWLGETVCRWYSRQKLYARTEWLLPLAALRLDFVFVQLGLSPVMQVVRLHRLW